jgi:uncharacterized protein (DUF2141 family)
MKNSFYIIGRLFRTKLFVLFLLVTTLKSHSEETNLKINILNLDKPGVLYLSICQDSESFERTVKESEEKNCINNSVEVDHYSAQTNMKLPFGEYAITLFVDFNGNKKIDKNFLGIPKEPYGFSNNVIGNMSAPTFDQAKFVISGPTSQNIKLRIGIPKQD